MSLVWGVCHKAIAVCLFLAGILGASQAVSSDFLATGGLTSQPIGHYEFCRGNRAECSTRVRDRGPERLTVALWDRLSDTNIETNLAIKPMTDDEVYGKEEFWAYPASGVGDCEDYVLEKRRRLANLGISLSNLLITVVRKPDGEGHAVLTVRTDKGDLVLDNLSDEIKLWHQTGYSFLKRQASTHTGRWISLRDENNVLVGAVEK